ncbi:MAG: ABC transporter ATP-binding protein, partial [Actinomycetota bacterium]|nr:ABC transporter ATP-binding protein [Actinomycetota bacterium]
NGAGKSTLLRILAGLIRPDAGNFAVTGAAPGGTRSSQVAYLDQDRPLYGNLSVSETLRLGRAMNHDWDQRRAVEHLERLGIDQHQKVGTLSGGQRAEVALTLCLAKHPRLLLLDEPFAGLDPLARGDLARVLLQSVVEDGTTVVLSSHVVAELADFCDHLLLLTGGKMRLAGEIDRLLARHRLLVGSVSSPLPTRARIVSRTASSRQLTLLVDADPLVCFQGWEAAMPSLGELIIAYLRDAAACSDEHRAGALSGSAEAR